MSHQQITNKPSSLLNKAKMRLFWATHIQAQVYIELLNTVPAIKTDERNIFLCTRNPSLVLFTKVHCFVTFITHTNQISYKLK
jgi:hypothetical protein